MMLNSLFVKNYRNFKHLEIPHLARVNLIGGKNNVGKTNLLEAVMLYVNEANPKMITQFLEKRDEYFGNEANLESSILSLISNKDKELFHNDGIRIGEIEGDKLKIKLGKYSIESFIDEKTGSKTQHLRELKPSENKVSNYKALKLYLYSTRTWIIMPLGVNFSSNEQDNTKAKGKILFSQYEFKSDLELWWDKISLMNKEAKVLEILQLIEPKIEGLSFIKPVPNAHRIPMVKLKEEKDKTSLKSLGEGVYKALRIAITLVNSENSVCAIDEIATGLHYSVLTSLWEMIFETAEKLNIQVFATTHSQDCIKAFAEVWNKGQSEGLYLRLQERPDGQIVAVPYKEDILLHAADRQIEMR